MQILAPAATDRLGEQVADCLDMTLSPLEERDFEDGEHKTRPLVSVRSDDVVVVQALYDEPERSVNEKLVRLLFLLATLREHGAARVTAVIPYLAYARKDRQTRPRDPVTTRYMAQLLEAVGTDMVMTLEVHNPAAFQNAFRCRTLHLDAHELFAERLRDTGEGSPLVVASPDPGGVKRAQLFRETLEAATGSSVGSAFMEKRRTEGRVSGTLLAGEMENATVILMDDLISTGGTLLRAAQACREAGARQVHALATHGLFTGNGTELLESNAVARILVADTVPPLRLPARLRQRLEIVGVAPLIAGALQRLHRKEHP